MHVQVARLWVESAQLCEDNTVKVTLLGSRDGSRLTVEFDTLESLDWFVKTLAKRARGLRRQATVRGTKEKEAKRKRGLRKKAARGLA